MDLFILGAGMGAVGGMFPNALHMIALTQVALGRWGRAIFVLLGPPLAVDGAFLFVTLFFFRFIPLGVAHDVAYVGGSLVIGFASYSLWEMRNKTHEEIANMAGTSRETVTRLLNQFRRDQWITIKGSSMTIVKPDQLERLTA